MGLPESICLLLNSLFPNLHPSLDILPEEYSEMEKEWNSQSFARFVPYVALEDKLILDAGCGLGGGTVYYAQHGAISVTGIDIDKKHLRYAKSFAKKEQISNAYFALTSLAALPFDDNTFDIVMLRDVAEHIPRPLLFQAFEECKRVLKKEGRFCISFPPWSYAFAAHLDEYIRIPWCHFLFRSETLVNVLNTMKPHERFGDLTNREHFDELSRLTIKEFKNIIRTLNFKVIHFRLRMLMNLRILNYVPFFRQYFASRVIAVLSK